MLTHEIDNFLDSLTDDELIQKWEKYEKYSERGTTTVTELLNHWSVHYKNTFVLDPCIPKELDQIKIKKSESNFGLFFNLVKWKRQNLH